MLADKSVAVSLAAGVSAGLAESVVHPMDTVICRAQSGIALPTAKASTSYSRTLHSGLYQGFGPTVVASIPASIAFFTVYESVKARLASARTAGHLQGVPRSVDYAAGSALAELLACAINNPAQVIKQNAQVSQRSAPNARRRQSRLPPSLSHTANVMKQFAKCPSALWTGYTLLVAAQLPCVCLTFSLYEILKQDFVLFNTSNLQKGNTGRQIQASVICGAMAGCCSAWAFVPADVVRIRMRLAAGRQIEEVRFQSATLSSPIMASTKSSGATPKALAVARDIIRKEGVTALFRGSILSCIAAGVGSGIYLGSYEAIKLHCDNQADVAIGL